MAIGIFAHSDGVFQDPILIGARAAARRHQTNLLIYCSPTMSNYSELDTVNIDSQYKVDRAELEGLVLVYSAPGLMQYGLSLYRAGLPVISIGRTLGELPHLLIENTTAIRDVVLNLASRGHRDIAYLTGPENNQCAQDRLAGYSEGIRQAGLHEDPGMILEGAFEENPGHAAVKRAWQNGLRFSAIVCANDLSAMGALKALKELGRSVPEEIEVTGFDNCVGSKLSRPTLSTFSTSNFELGYLATEQIVRATRGDLLPTRTTIPVDFVARQSTRLTAKTTVQPQRSDFWSLPPREADLWLARLRDIKGADAPLKQLEECNSSDEFIASAKISLRITEEHGIPPACLHDTITSAVKRSSGITLLALSEALELLHETILRLEYNKAELNAQFISHTARLRELTIQPTDETILLEEMKRVLWVLGVPYAEIYLTVENAPNDIGLYNAIGWSSAAPLPHFREERRHLTPFSSPHMIRERGGPSGSSMVVPLIFHNLQYGVAVVSRETSHEFSLPELIRQFSTAIYSNRAHRARQRSEVELEKTHRELLKLSRQAGMAEIATGVLHNVGNVLNSVNVSVSLAVDHVHSTKTSGVAKVAALFDQHKADLADYITRDSRGRLIPSYLGGLAEQLAAEQKTLLKELEHISENVEHIKDIVAVQQTYASTSGPTEMVSVPDLIEDALGINARARAKVDVETIRDYQTRPIVKTDKHQVTQILINLVRNAEQACDESGRTDKQITVRVTSDDRSVKIAIIDNGIGIPVENFTRIFNHGFTTRKDGHGFGLHTSALAAKNLGGSIHVESGGPRQGATFVLELPCEPGAPHKSGSM